MKAAAMSSQRFTSAARSACDSMLAKTAPSVSIVSRLSSSFHAISPAAVQRANAASTKRVIVGTYVSIASRESAALTKCLRAACAAPSSPLITPVPPNSV